MGVLSSGNGSAGSGSAVDRMNSAPMAPDDPNGDGSVEFTELPAEDEVDADTRGRFREVVLHATDWTTETIVSQLGRGNISLNPSFQRRDAWNVQQKSRFIESLILGLPVPQIVLAEEQNRRGKFIVLDGKQRLLAILQFWGLGEGSKNGYSLTGLEFRKADLAHKDLPQLKADPDREDDLNALLNQPIRTVVIKNWPDEDFLHIVFLRLNTGSVKLSPQELRQALFPGEFSSWIDEVAVGSRAIKRLLRLDEPDYRMRDIEVLARFLAFRFFLSNYRGRMKKFLDFAFKTFNADWGAWKERLEQSLSEFEAASDALVNVFGSEVGRKPGSKQFNRAVFDFLAFYASEQPVREAMTRAPDQVRQVFDGLFHDADFRRAIERDTAGVPNTVERLSKWGSALGSALGMELPVPTAVAEGQEERVAFPGF